MRPVFVGLDEMPPRPKVAAVLQLHESTARFVDLALGVKLDRRCAAVDTRGRCLRDESFGNLHFGILYTF